MYAHIAGAVCGAFLAASPAWAVKTETWKHQQPKDFASGKMEQVVSSSLGELLLGRETRKLHEPGEKADVINALAQAGDGMVYAATGPRGVIYRIDGDKVSEFATLQGGGTILSLVFAKDGKLLAGTGGGEQAVAYKIDGTGKASVFYEPKGAKYVWAMARGPEGQVYLATGVEGQLHVVDADGTHGKVLADLKPKNLLCLAYGTDGQLYTGTDEHGLVYRINPATGGQFVMYDAKEPEISAIVLDADGNIYASTADAEAARPGRAVADKPGGRPEQPATQPASRAGSPPSSRPSGGKTDGGGADQAKTAPSKNATPPKVGRPTDAAGPKAGNAIYRIDTDGFVTEIFREPVMILAMVEAAGTIYAGTGEEGRIYSITPAEDRTTMMAKLEATQATALLRLRSDHLLVGTANSAALVRVSSGYAEKGTFTSEPLDAGQIVKWGRILWDASVAAGTKLTVATRTGNVQDEESDAWEAWSPEMDATTPQQISSAGARFLQYRLTFETTVPGATPVLRMIQIARIQENRPPLVSSLLVTPGREEAKQPTGPPQVKAAVGTLGPEATDCYWVIKWKAEDPNEDQLVHEVFFREIDSTRWVRMETEKELKEPLYLWDTRTVSDGQYEVRVVARDMPSNAPGTDLESARISDPITVDNTPPEITVERLEPQGKDALRVHALFRDARSPIAEASYSVDSGDEWKALAADDDIFDAPGESATFTVGDLEPGEHRIAIRVRDQRGNTRYVSRPVTIGD